jgi:hypothetical protein
MILSEEARRFILRSAEQSTEGLIKENKDKAVDFLKQALEELKLAEELGYVRKTRSGISQSKTGH